METLRGPAEEEEEEERDRTGQHPAVNVSDGVTAKQTVNSRRKRLPRGLGELTEVENKRFLAAAEVDGCWNRSVSRGAERRMILGRRLRVTRVPEV